MIIWRTGLPRPYAPAIVAAWSERIEEISTTTNQLFADDRETERRAVSPDMSDNGISEMSADKQRA
jgi:hypothetical protein